jgi:hypothetical protein
VTEIGEKEKMKTKLLASIVVLMLLMSTFGFTFMMMPNVKAGDLVHLNVWTSPSFLQGTSVKINGTGDWPEGSTVHLQAPQYAYVESNTRYQFYKWHIDGTSWDGNYEFNLLMNANHNVTAVYDNPGYPVQYLVTVNLPALSLIKNFTAHLWVVGVGDNTNDALPTVSKWIDNGTKVQPGCEGIGYYPEAYVYGKNYNELLRFLNWSVCGGFYNNPVPPLYIDWGKPVKILGPKIFSPDWEYVYRIYACDCYTNGYTQTCPEDGWYSKNYVLKINAIKYTFTTASDRWRFNYWKVDGKVIDGAPYPVACIQAVSGENITIKVDGNHTVCAWYKYQFKVDFTQSLPDDYSGVGAQSNYYDENTKQSFTAKPYCNQSSTYRYRFNRWYGYQATPGSPPGWFGNLTNRSFTINVTKYMKFYAEYLTQWHIQIFTKPTCSSLLPLMYLKGWTGEPGWFDHQTSTATFGAPAVYDFHNGTKLIFKEWDYDGGVFYSNQNNTQWAGVWHAENFTAVYTRYYRITLKAEPAIFAWEKEYWAQEGFWGWFWPDATWPDPGGYVYYFDHWTVTPYANLDGPTWLGVNLNTSYTATAYYRLGTTLVMDPLGVEAETRPGHGYCTTFKMSIKVTNVKDMYAVQAKVNFVNTHLKIVGVDTTPLNQVWGTGKWFVADDLDYTNGYDFYATAVGNNTKSFTGSAILVTITFHIIYEPCVPPDIWDWIYFTDYALYYKNGTKITMDPVLDGRYHMKVLKPALKGFATISNGGHTVTIDIYAVNVTKLHDYEIWLNYDLTQLKLKTWWFDTSFLQGVYTVSAPATVPGVWAIYVEEITGYFANGTGPLLHLVFDAVLVGSALDKITFDPVKCHISEKCDQGIIYIYHQGGSYTFLDLMDATMPDPLAGDANLDGVVDIYDLRLVAYYLGKLTTVWGGPAPPSCDFNCDGWITMLDLITVAVNFGHHI